MRGKNLSPLLDRRQVLAGLGAVVLVPSPVLAQATLDVLDFGVTPGANSDQSAALQAAIDAAAAAGKPLFLPGQRIYAQNLTFPAGLTLQGTPGASEIVTVDGAAPVATIALPNVTIDGVAFLQGAAKLTGGERSILEIKGAEGVSITRCAFRNGFASGIALTNARASIEDCDFANLALAGIHSLDSKGLIVSNNAISDCGNVGIAIWGSANRRDGSIVMGNQIARIRSDDGGNGQNGNGINVYLCDEVIVSDNHIADCAFTAIRLNSTNNTQVNGNTCINSGEVAIFSEFAFSGSVIGNNIIDGAATGISITNLDSGGRLAVCTGNVVRNITPASAVNPDTLPIGIYVEAETTVTSNVIDSVPGIAIVAGFGPYLRNVVIANNVVSGSNTGIGVSVVDSPSPGPVRISGNLISDPAQYGIVGLAWTEIVTDDLVRDAAQFPHVTISDNTVARG